MTAIDLTTGAEMAAFWACRDSVHAQLHHATRDRSEHSPTRVSNAHHELVWTIEAAQALQPTYDIAAKMPGRCWTRPEAEGGIALCGAPLDETTVRRIIDEARAFVGDLEAADASRSAVDAPKALAS